MVFLRYRDRSSMPNHSSMSPRRLIPFLGAALAMLAAAAPARAVVGGTAAEITAHPYQVALLDAAEPDNHLAQFCAGVIRDSLHVITAAHCVSNTPFTQDGQPMTRDSLEVLAGTKVMTPTSEVRSQVDQISLNPRFDPLTLENDSALVTLRQPLVLGNNRAPVELADNEQWDAVPPGASLTVSGWGATADSQGEDVNALQAATVDRISSSTCTADYGSEYVASVMTCAGDPVAGGRDACSGDSGGPLVRAFGPTLPLDYKLVGIVSWGPAAPDGTPICGDPDGPGVYTTVAAPSVRNYIAQGSPVAAPANRQAPLLSGTPQVGSALACATGRWSGSPDLAIQWVRTSGGVDVPVANRGAAATYVPSSEDLGSSISCIVFATNPGGESSARSQPSDAVVNAPEGAPSPPPAPAPIALVDTARPVARILTARCVKQTCTLTLRVTDAGVSAGIAKVTGSVRSTYRRSGRTRHRTRTFTARRTASTRFTVKLTKLPVGTQLFSLLATDKAGHRQLLPTRKTLKTKR